MYLYINAYFFNIIYSNIFYRHLSDKQLSLLLQGLKISLNETQDIVTTAKQGHYQIACLKHFEVTHPGHQGMDLGSGSQGFMEHPNQWFKASVQYHKIKSGTAAGSNMNTNKMLELDSSTLKRPYIATTTTTTATATATDTIEGTPETQQTPTVDPLSSSLSHSSIEQSLLRTEAMVE